MGQGSGVLSFSSYTTPPSIFRYSASTGKRNLWFRNPVPFDSDRFETEQVWYTSKDGTRVPMFLVHRKGYKPNGQTPVLLYGYGGFNVSLNPNFSTNAVVSEARAVFTPWPIYVVALSLEKPGTRPECLSISKMFLTTS